MWISKFAFENTKPRVPIVAQRLDAKLFNKHPYKHWQRHVPGGDV
jgi:hypothetical protein